MVVKLQSDANDQREISPKVYNAELWFLCMTHCLIVLYNCMKFHLNRFNGCQLTEHQRNSIANDQREITPKISKVELWFVCMTHCFILRYKCMKFQPVNYFHILLTGKRNTTIKVIATKIYKAELWFLCIKHCLIVLYNCMKFRLNSFNGCQVTERCK